MSEDDARYVRGFLTVQYLMGRRGEQLQAPERTTGAPNIERHLEGLRSQDRLVRAKWLGRGLNPLRAALDERRWDAP